ncbi:MAG: 50S ribosomal protein L35 [Fibrobacteria bacterium]|nr:50S ribosomal protein L35 [Fibrobacteria bacterium]
MPKMKTHSGAKKRFKLTAKGKIKRFSSKLNHIMAKQSPKSKRQLGKASLISKADTPRIKRLLAS